MISEKLGGKGIAMNLSIITKSLNGLMESGPEQNAKDKTAGSKILYYETTWENHPQKGKIKNFAKSIKVTIKEYKNGKKVKVGTYPFTQAAPPETAKGVKFNLNEVGRPTMITQFGVTYTFVLEVLEAKNKFGTFSDLTDLVNKITLLYNKNGYDKSHKKWSTLKEERKKLRIALSNSQLEIKK
jgi:hypothetical protein